MDWKKCICVLVSSALYSICRYKSYQGASVKVLINRQGDICPQVRKHQRLPKNAVTVPAAPPKASPRLRSSVRQAPPLCVIRFSSQRHTTQAATIKGSTTKHTTWVLITVKQLTKHSASLPR